MTTGTCIICFSNNTKVLNINNSHLQYSYEKLSGYAVSNNYNACCICCTRLQQFYFLIKQTEDPVDLENQQVYTNTQLTTVNVENASIPYHTATWIKQETVIRVKVEKLSDTEDEIDVGYDSIPNILNCLQTKIKKPQKLPKAKKKNEYFCDICNKLYTSKSSFERHKKTHANGPCICHICGAQLTRKANLKKHMMIHNNEKPYACNVCNKKYKRSDYLKLHIMVHSEKKLFFCEVCGMQFRRQTSLRAHKLLHTNRVYICDICKKKFNRKGNMKVHIMGHSDNKPYKCGACEKSYITNRILKLHQQKHCPVIKANAMYN